MSRVSARRFPTAALAIVLAAGVVGCGASDAGSDGRPEIVVSNVVIADVVSSLLGDAATVTSLVPAGASPHDVQVSARQAAEIREADLVVVNGGGFEAGLEDVVDSARDEGVPVHEAISAVDDLLLADEEGHEDDHDDGHDHEHGDEGVDPHVFTDPVRAAQAARGILAEVLEVVPELDTPEVRERADAYLARLDDLDAEVRATLAGVDDDRRVLVTNHESLRYFADRYDFRVVGAVIPSTSTGDTSSARDLEELAEVVRSEDVPAIFADTSSPTRLADALADEVGGIEVVLLYTESLGEPGSGADTYEGMIRTNAERIADALGGA
jgi:zinc/manganese transport system substrate-binding protein